MLTKTHSTMISPLSYQPATQGLSPSPGKSRFRKLALAATNRFPKIPFLKTWVSVIGGSGLFSMFHRESRHEQQQEGCAAEDVANRVKQAPPPQEVVRLFRAQVEFVTLQPFIGRQDYDKRERDNQQQE